MRSWCFDSQESGGVYDREYGSSEIREVMGKLIGNGVYATPSTNMQIIADSGLTTKMQPGSCWINGAFGVADTEESFTHDPSASGRIDIIVARFDLSLSYRSIRSLLIKGTEGLTTAPSLIQTDSIRDILLARVNVRAGETSILQSDITDMRHDSTVCGIVAGIIDQIDTTDLFAQYQSAFYAFMAELEDVLTGDVAGNLLQLINDHKADASNPHSVTKSQIGLGNVANVLQYSADNKPTKSDIGLGNVANELQYSGNYKPYSGSMVWDSHSLNSEFDITLPFTPALVLCEVYVGDAYPQGQSGMHLLSQGTYTYLYYDCDTPSLYAKAYVTGNNIHVYKAMANSMSIRYIAFR